MFSFFLWICSIRRLFGRSTITRLPRRKFFRPLFEMLEDRTVPTTLSVNAGDIATLIIDISQANTSSSSSRPYIIDLTNSTYSFTSTNNTTGGNNVLPVISAANLTIVPSTAGTDVIEALIGGIKVKSMATVSVAKS